MINSILRPFRKLDTKSVTKFIFRKVRSGDLILDCGVSVGDITQKFLSRGAQVHCFEPNPLAFKYLQKRFEGNEMVTLINKGVWDRSDTLPFYLHENLLKQEVTIDLLKKANGSSLLDVKSNVVKSQPIEIEVISLSEYINSLNRKVKVLKLDVEGAECEILEDLINSKVYEKIKYIVVETHERIPELREKTAKVRDLIHSRRIKNINLNWV